MSKWKLEQWCVYATARIRYIPDRRAVYKELREHVNERCEHFRALGDSEEEAVERTLDAMGDAKEVALMLGKVHRPFWGYLYSAAVVLCLSLLIQFTVRVLLMPVDFADPSDVDSYFDSSYVGGQERVFYTEPGISTSCDGYTFTLSKAILWRTNLTEGDHETMETLTIRLDVSNPRPWEKKAEVMPWIWAEDSAGNYYYSVAEHNGDRHMISGNQHITGRFTVSYVMHLGWHLPENVEWVDLRYTRDGRDWTLRIDLTGGTS